MGRMYRGSIQMQFMFIEVCQPGCIQFPNDHEMLEKRMVIYDAVHLDHALVKRNAYSKEN